MDRKRLIVTSAVVLLLATLVVLQVHSWRKFDWDIVGQSLEQLNWWKILGAVALVHIADGLRAVRWAIFLKPVKKNVSFWSLLPAQYIGFAGLALLGRPGEVIRPLVIARRTGLTFSSQFAVWTVERIFDISAVTVIVAADLLFSGTLQTFTDKQYNIMRALGAVLIFIVFSLLFFAFSAWRNGEQIAQWLERKLSHKPHLAHRIAAKIRIFSTGLHTIHDVSSFLGISVLSVAIWLLIAGSYYAVLQSYADETVYTMTFVYGIILMAFSVAGGILQLPLVGGGSQLSTIKALYSLFNTPQELATSCGIMLWLVTFVSVTPLGLLLARVEHVSLRKLGAESHMQEEQAEEEAERPGVVDSV